MILWVTDLHLNFIKSNNIKQWIENIDQKYNPESMIITGDISDGLNIIDNLYKLAKNFGKPIYFVLGNHDFYHSSFLDINKKINSLVKNVSNLFWLDKKSFTKDDFSIVGSTGWYDAKSGNTNTQIELNDFRLIRELIPGSYSRDFLIKSIREISANYNKKLLKTLKEVTKSDSSTIIIATHVAPYVEAAVHEGRSSDSEWAPWFVNTGLGDILDDCALTNSSKRFIVLCGHSHSPGIYHRSDNLIVYTGKSLYRYPDISGTINLEDRIIYCFDKNKNMVTEKI